MAKWVLGYWTDGSDKRSVEHWFLKLPKEQLKSVAKELKLLETFGNELKLPHSRSLSNGLFELRERNHGYRIYYGFCAGKIVVLLHAGNKSKQQNDISIARIRLKDLHLRNIRELAL